MNETDISRDPKLSKYQKGFAQSIPLVPNMLHCSASAVQALVLYCTLLLPIGNSPDCTTHVHTEAPCAPLYCMLIPVVAHPHHDAPLCIPSRVEHS